jgi:hypothetical protein
MFRKIKNFIYKKIFNFIADLEEFEEKKNGGDLPRILILIFTNLSKRKKQIYLREKESYMGIFPSVKDFLYETIVIFWFIQKQNLQ